jgi:hypothetical protein
MRLINKLVELQKFIKVDSTFPEPPLAAYQPDAIESYLVDALGDELTEQLVAWYEAQLAVEGEAGEPSAEDTVMMKLLPYAQRVVARFAFMIAAPNLDLKLLDSGFGVVSTEALVPASKDRVNRFIQALESDGWNAVEQLLRFLEKNKDDYQGWVDSEAYTLQLRNFINSAEEFDKHVNIGKSRLKFKNIRQVMDAVELLQVIPVIGELQAEELKEQMKDGSLSEANAKLLTKVKRATANLTAEKAGMGAQYGMTGESFLNGLRRWLDEHMDDYPIYKNSLYVPERNFETFENSTDYGFFVGGS